MPLGALNAIRMGLELVDEDVMIRNGDVVADINLKKMIQRFGESNYPAVIFITRMRSPYGIVEISDDRIKRFHEKPLLNEYINGGVYCFTRDSAQLFHNFKTGEIEKTVFPLLAESNQLGYYREENMLWTMYILSGQGYIKLDDRIEPFERNDTIKIEPAQPHTIVATENTTIHEVSTPHPDDTIRIRDPYERDRREE